MSKTSSKMLHASGEEGNRSPTTIYQGADRRTPKNSNVMLQMGFDDEVMVTKRTVAPLVASYEPVRISW